MDSFTSYTLIYKMPFRTKFNKMEMELKNENISNRKNLCNTWENQKSYIKTTYVFKMKSLIYVDFFPNDRKIHIKHIIQENHRNITTYFENQIQIFIQTAKFTKTTYLYSLQHIRKLTSHTQYQVEHNKKPLSCNANR